VDEDHKKGDWQVVTHVSYIPDVPISNLGGGKDYFVWGILRFPSVPPGKSWNSTGRLLPATSLSAH